MVIRIPDRGELQSIVEIEQENASPWSAEQISAELSYLHGVRLVAVDDEGRISGWCCARSAGPEAELLKIAVRLDDRRTGIAAALLVELEKRLLERQVEVIFLEVRSLNEPALRFYRKYGYSRVGERPGYYSDPADDALILRKEFFISNG